MIDLTNNKILKSIVLFTIPIFIGEFLQQLYTLVDSIFVGRFIDTAALASIGAVQPIYGLITSIFLGVSIGFSILLAYQKGEGKSEEYSKTIYTLFIVTIVFYLILFFLKNIITDGIVSFMHLSPDISENGIIYLNILMQGMIFCFVQLSLGAILRAFGDTKTPLIMSISGSLINIVLDYIFVGRLKWGIKGAAYATLIAQLASLVLILPAVFYIYKIKFKHIISVKFSLSYLKRAVLYGIPLAIQYIFLSIGVILLVKIILPLGVTVMGAFTIIGRLEPFISMLFLNLSSGLTTFTAQNYGAEKYDRIKEGLKKVLLTVFVLSIIEGVGVIICSGYISGIFTTDINTKKIVIDYLVITSPFLFLYGIMVVYHGFLNGLGKTIVPLICTIISFLVVRIPLSYFFRDWFGYKGLMWTVVIGWFVGLVYTYISKVIIFKKKDFQNK
ncbi:putative efflux protein, MATE family [Treponema bryantii]|uniref:Multidrug-efflux transporter n=1 Tax=Treponema bryantii TaxID=163 RepID=A0A1H9HHJ1_9SPIR|nr:MATE family efflux transporter [Treponema bryantii]SEQ61823.1 putative efflux protein, MATE family [Treponema bryantii]